MDGVAEEVPTLVIPCQYIVPPPPPLAVSVALLQYVPPPLTETELGVEFIVTDALPSVPQPQLL
jgi:hypothetical protein